MTAYRHPAYRSLPEQVAVFRPAQTVFGASAASVTTSAGETLPLADPRVTVLIPSMGETAAQMLAAVFESEGFSAVAHPAADEAILKLGRAHTACKECLPLILTAGTLIHYVRELRRPGEIVAYFMPTGSGPCRFGQYAVFMEDLIRRLEIPDVAVVSLTSENSYAGTNAFFRLRAWWAAVISDALEDIRSLILVRADDPRRGMDIFAGESRRLVSVLGQKDFRTVLAALEASLGRLAAVPGLDRPHPHLPVVALIGEIFVRRDDLARRHLIEILARRGFAVVCSPVSEWILYTNYLVRKNIVRHHLPTLERLKLLLVERYVGHYTRALRRVLRQSGLGPADPIDIDGILRHARPFLSPHLTGEAILTIGSALSEIATSVCGVISIGPFGCMPGRLAEAILTDAMRSPVKTALTPGNRALKKILADFDELPFLPIESDGSPFPPLLEAKLDAFCLGASRLKEAMAGPQRR